MVHQRKQELTELFQGRRVLVAGDLMADRYLWGEVSRISPEAPVPILRVLREELVPGGAANVAANLAALGARVELAGVVGDDEPGEILLRLLADMAIGTHGVVRTAGRPTTQKVRLMGGRQQLLRVDREVSEPLDVEITTRICATVISASTAAIVVSDYLKGVVTPSLMDAVRSHAAPAVGDPKPANAALFRGLRLVTPNLREAGEIAGRHDLPPEPLSDQLRQRLDGDVLITLGERGMALRTAAGYLEIPARARQVFDVSGAGDTVAAVVALGIAAGLDTARAAAIANVAAGIVVGKSGTATVTTAEIAEHWDGEGPIA